MCRGNHRCKPTNASLFLYLVALHTPHSSYFKIFIVNLDEETKPEKPEFRLNLHMCSPSSPLSKKHTGDQHVSPFCLSLLRDYTNAYMLILSKTYGMDASKEIIQRLTLSHSFNLFRKVTSGLCMTFLSCLLLLQLDTTLILHQNKTYCSS
jgi:hypothetical protein